jgi:hypothetical protein
MRPWAAALVNERKNGARGVEAATLPMNRLPDTDLLEFVCNENEPDVRHLNVK